ncbi:hypothetical protein [Roseimaritima sediminicola]|uniref:hypothetical protein n=1 Tax=Roseimaritima sediminicola TaxID=2662066 RepID=UPI00129834A6|nr:hypothetical protein [Roseimaritima sediminicola]
MPFPVRPTRTSTARPRRLPPVAPEEPQAPADHANRLPAPARAWELIRPGDVLPPAPAAPATPARPRRLPEVAPQAPRGPSSASSPSRFAEPPPVHPGDFQPTPLPAGSDRYDPAAQQYVYDAKRDVPTQRPIYECGIPFYSGGMMPRGGTLLGETHLTHPAFYVYGDYRVGAASGRNAIGRVDNVAHRLNLDMDLRLTATERFHAFIGPFNRAAQFSQVRFVDGSVEYDPNFNLNPVTAFFEGDAGAILGGIDGTPSPFELPFSVGLVPLLFQNGIWMEDAVTGAAMALPARHSRLLDWSNFDLTGFAIADQLNSPAFGNDAHAGQALGTAIFIEAYDGYIEAGYAYVHDRIGLGRSYHNMTASYTRRYFDRVNNSVRVIVNAGQDLPSDQRTADGGLLLVESSLATADSLRILPYLNLFVGWDRPQSVARAGVSGGILRNVGINFEPDGLNGHPTLDATANNTLGGAIGIDLLGAALDRQWIIETAYVATHRSAAGRIARGDQWGLASRYQFPLSHRTLLRFDVLYGVRENDTDLYGGRMEFRWKF